MTKKEGFFVDSSGRAARTIEELVSDDPVLARDRLEAEAAHSDKSKQLIGLGKSEREARDAFVVERLYTWPEEALLKLIGSRPSDNLAYEALKKKQDREALRQKLIQKGREKGNN